MAEETVSKGEVCSIETAKILKIDDIVANNRHYLSPQYADVKTYNDAIDNADNNRSFMLCEKEKDNAVAPICGLQAGFGFTKIRNPETLEFDTCATLECPSGFKQDKTNQLKCIKPNIEKTIIRKNIADSRWYDWFMIPEYHLGNKYARINGVNYAPCIKGSVPSYSEDPVDKEKRSFSSNNKDELDKCVSKNAYFGGKYFTSETHCPIAWVYRAGATKKFLKEKYLEQIEDLNINNNGTPYLDKLKNLVTDIIEDEVYDPVVKYGFKDYIGKPRSTEAELACSMLNNDSYKKDNARIICQTFKELGKEGAIERIMDENDEDEKIATKRYLRTTQACHALFCDTESKLCFDSVTEAELKHENENKTQETEEPPIDSLKTSKEIGQKTLVSIIVPIIVGTLFIMFMFFYIQKVHPYVKVFVIPPFINFLKSIKKASISVTGFVG